MKTIKILSFILAFIMGIVLVIAIFLPADIHIKKTITIKGELGVVYNEVNNLRNWDHWSPWKDSTLLTKYEGTDKGIGAKMLWTDQKEGRAVVTITESSHFTTIKTEMSVPNQESNAPMIFSFEKAGDSIIVTWEHHLNDLSYPMERYVGWMLEKGFNYNFDLGLKGLKEYVEANLQTVEYYGYNVELIEFTERSYLAVNDSAKAEDMGDVMANGFGAIIQFATKLEIQPQGPAMVQWQHYDPTSYSYFTSLVPYVIDGPIASKKVYNFTMPTSQVAMIRYIGPYEGSYNAWMALDNYVVFNSKVMNGNPWEEYVVGPTNESDSTKFVTNICFPIK